MWLNANALFPTAVRMPLGWTLHNSADTHYQSTHRREKETINVLTTYWQLITNCKFYANFKVVDIIMYFFSCRYFWSWNKAMAWIATHLSVLQCSGESLQDVGFERRCLWFDILQPLEHPLQVTISDTRQPLLPAAHTRCTTNKLMEGS